jgi:O-antigen polymerase
MSQRKANINIGVIDLLLLARFIWILIGYTELLSRHEIFELALIIIYFTSGFVLKNFNFSEYLAAFLLILLFSGFVQSAIGIYEHFFYATDVNGLQLKSAMSGTIGSSNSLGQFFTISLLAGNAVLWKTPNRFKWIILIIAAIILTSLLLTRSRGAILALICGFITMKVLMVDFTPGRKHRLKKYRWSIISGIAVSLTGFLLMLYQMDAESSFGRLFVWDISLQMYFDHPILGLGFNRFGDYFNTYQANYLALPENMHLAYKAANLKQAHNEYIQAFVETGIVGGLIYLAIWLTAFFFILTKVKSSQYYVGIAAIFISLSIHSFLDTPMRFPAVGIIWYLALAFADKKAISIKIPRIAAGLLSFFFLISLVLGIPFFVKQYNANRYWGRGLSSARTYQWTNAISHYEKANLVLVNNMKLRFNLGAAHIMNGNYFKGIGLLEQAKSQMTDFNLLMSLGYGYMQTSQFLKAENSYNEALFLFPDRLYPRVLLAEVYLKQGYFNKAKRELLLVLNRKTKIHTEDVRKVIAEAKQLWRQYNLSD